MTNLPTPKNTKFKPTLRTVCESILMFADTRKYIGAEYPGLIDQIREAIENDDADRAAKTPGPVINIDSRDEEVLGRGFIDTLNANEGEQ